MSPAQAVPQRPPSGGSSWIVAWLLLTLAAPVALIWFSVGDLFKDVGRGSSDVSARPDGSGHTSSPRAEEVLAEHRAEVQEWLSTYGWVDRAGGIARVPIEEGMRAVLRDGLPAREELEGEQ